MGPTENGATTNLGAATFDAVVVGAGVHGLCAAWQLRQRGLARVAVLEQFAFGHAAGGSHGSARIMRSSYHDAVYVELAQDALTTGWPQLARDLGTELLTATPGVFFGPDSGRMRAFVGATLGSGAAVEEIDVATARRRFPLLRFDADARVLLDHTAGVLAAGAVLAGLRRWARDHEVVLAAHTPVSAFADERDAVRLSTARGEVWARHVVLACGAWLPVLVPALGARCVALRQHVGYFAAAADPPTLRAPRFPVWARLGASDDDFVYGLPAFGGDGLKLARHRTHGGGDPLAGDRDPTDPGDPAALEALAARHFAVPVERRAHETCVYAMLPGEHFLVDRLPHLSRVVVVSACSGHGFKFAPVVARLAADVLLGGRRPPASFAWPSRR